MTIILIVFHAQTDFQEWSVVRATSGNVCTRCRPYFGPPLKIMVICRSSLPRHSSLESNFHVRIECYISCHQYWVQVNFSTAPKKWSAHKNYFSSSEKESNLLLQLTCQFHKMMSFFSSCYIVPSFAEQNKYELSRDIDI